MRREEHDAALIARATSFYAKSSRTSRNSLGKLRMESEIAFSDTLEGAERIAQTLADATGRSFAVYAVAGEEGCHVKNIYPSRNAR